MSDRATGGRGVPEPHLLVSYPYDENGTATIYQEAADIEELFGAKRISYHYASTVENSFGLFK